MDWDKLVNEHITWEERNFPEPDKEKSMRHRVFGVMEEAGELAHAHLKHAQDIRGMSTENLFILKARDAIGDVTIYLLGVMGELSYTPDPFIPQWAQKQEDADRWLLGLGKAVGKLCEHPQWTPAVHSIVYHLHMYCQAQGWNYEEIVTETWTKVSQRDWVTDPVAGGE